MPSTLGIQLLVESIGSDARSSLPCLSTIADLIAAEQAVAVAVVAPPPPPPPALPPTGPERAFALVAEANRMLDGGLHRCKEWGEVKDAYFHAGALFAESGMHSEAADAFSSSAAICRIYGDALEVATAIGFTIDSCKICDPMRAATLLKEQADILKGAGRQLHAAKCLRDLAQISEQLGLDEDAVAYYKQAINLFGNGPNTQALSRPCKVRVAHITAFLGRYRDAVPHFEHLAETCVAPVAPTQFYFKAVLCLFADAQGERYAGGIAKAKAKFLDYQDLDPLFQKGVENQLLRGIIAAFDKPSLSNMDVAFAQYRDMRGGAPDDWFDHVGAAIRNNLFQYLLPFM